MIRARGIKVHTNKKAQLYKTTLSLQTKGFLVKCNTLVESEFKLVHTHQCLRVGVLIYLFPVTVHRLVQKADTDSTASMTVRPELAPIGSRWHCLRTCHSLTDVSLTISVTPNCLIRVSPNPLPHIRVTVT